MPYNEFTLSNGICTIQSQHITIYPHFRILGMGWIINVDKTHREITMRFSVLGIPLIPVYKYSFSQIYRIGASGKSISFREELGILAFPLLWILGFIGYIRDGLIATQYEVIIFIKGVESIKIGRANQFPLFLRLFYPSGSVEGAKTLESHLMEWVGQHEPH